MKERLVKKKVRHLLASEDDLDRLIAEVGLFPRQQAITALMSGLYDIDERVKWHAVTATGALVDDLARQDMEAARLIMRRILWNLNEESGGIGWGMAEVMGEILAENRDLAAEYAHMLVSYMREENYLELPALQRGLMWGVGRLALVRPELLLKHHADGYMENFLESPDRIVQGLASRNFGILGVREAAPIIRGFVDIETPFILYRDRELIPTTVGEQAREALAKLEA